MSEERKILPKHILAYKCIKCSGRKRLTEEEDNRPVMLPMTIGAIGGGILGAAWSLLVKDNNLTGTILCSAGGAFLLSTLIEGVSSIANKLMVAKDMVQEVFEDPEGSRREHLDDMMSENQGYRRVKKPKHSPAP